jgi:hypothetical protein
MDKVQKSSDYNTVKIFRGMRYIFQVYVTTVSQIVFYLSLEFEILKAVVMNVVIFRDMARYSPHVSRRRSIYGLYGAIYEKMATYSVLPPSYRKYSVTITLLRQLYGHSVRISNFLVWPCHWIVICAGCIRSKHSGSVCSTFRNNLTPWFSKRTFHFRF